MNDPDDQRRLKRARNLRSLLLNAGMVAAVFLVVMAFQSRNMLPAGGEKAPQLSGMTLTGEPYDLADAGKRPAVIYFFAPWCRICAASSGNLVRLRGWRDADDLEIVAVALDWGDAGEVSAYAEHHGLNMTVLLGNADTGRRWQVRAYPSYYVLDSNHRIVRRDIGYSSQLGLWWRSWFLN